MVTEIKKDLFNTVWFKIDYEPEIALAPGHKNYELAKYAHELSEIVKRIREIHYRYVPVDLPGKIPGCLECKEPYPCNTIKALEGEIK